jgi:molybdate transport system regulatory protein
MPNPTVRFRIEFGPQCAVGPGKIALLEQILQIGSLSGAADKLAMSYRRAWLLLESLNTSFVKQVANSNQGGTTLTPFGLELIRLYRALEIDLQARAARQFRPLKVQAPKTKRIRATWVMRRSVAKRKRHAPHVR